MHFLAIDHHPPRNLVELDAAHAQHWLVIALGLSATERGPNTGQQLINTEWLGHIVVSARVERLDLACLVR